MNRERLINWKTVSAAIVVVLGLVCLKAFYFGFFHYEDVRPDGRYRIVVSHVPTMLDLQAVPPGDSADKYVWVRLYAEDGRKLNETLTLLNSLPERMWGEDVVFVTGEIVWTLPGGQ